MNYKIDSSAVFAAAEGNWRRILWALAPALATALERAPRHVPCPIHGGKDGFRLFGSYEKDGGGVCNTCGSRPNGVSLLMWVNGWTYPETLQEVAREIGLEVGKDKPRRKPVARPLPPPPPKEPDLAPELLRARLNEVWAESLPLNHPAAEPVKLYLGRRGLDPLHLPDVLRFHPNLPHKAESGEITRWPAMLAPVVDAAGNPKTVHRTYLTPAGAKAPVDKAKKLMAHPLTGTKALMGGGIRLGSVEKILGVAEGIETALAVAQATGMSCWSTVSSSLLAGFRPPDGVEYVVVWGDKDAKGGGQAAAKELVERLRSEGMKTVGMIPKFDVPPGKKSVDWLDVFVQCGPQLFPRVDSILTRF